MLLKPSWCPSTTYIKVPSNNTNISTAERKRVILYRLCFKAPVSTFASLVNGAIFKIRKTLNRRISLTTNKNCAPVKAKLKYVGIEAMKSTMPQKLKMYRSGFGLIIMRQIYSMEKSMVKNHSM